MFEESLVESTHRIQGQSRWTVALSVAIQASIAAAIIAVPLMHPESLRHIAFVPPQLFAPVPPPPPPPPMRVMAHLVEASSAVAAAAAPVQLVRATEHSAVDALLRPHAGDESLDVPPGVSTVGIAMGNTSTVGDGIFGTAPHGPAIAVASPGKPVRLSTGVSAGMLIEPIRPVYPRIAQAARMEGTVIVHAIISKTGAIESAKVVSGPAMLQGAALEAVRNARYRPYKLNGEATEVDTTINITFHLSEG